MSKNILAQSATQLSMSGMTIENVSLHLPALVDRLIVETESKNGTKTLTTGKGEQRTFSAACKTVKDLLRIDKTERLPDNVAESIATLVKQRIKSRIDSLFAEYQDHEITVKSNALGVDFDGDIAVDVYKQATVTMRRRNLTDSDKYFGCVLRKESTQKAIDKIRSKPALDNADRVKLEHLNRKLDSIESLKEHYQMRLDEAAKSVTEQNNKES